MTELLVIGADGLDGALIDGYFEDADECKKIESYPPRAKDNERPFTGQAWPVIYTGRHVPRYGQTDLGPKLERGFIRFEEDIGDTIFDDISNAGLRLGSFKMAVTWPAPTVNGWMLSGFPSGTISGEADESECHGIDDHPTFDLFGEQCFDEFSVDIIDKVLEDERRRRVYAARQYTGDEDVFFYGTQLPDKIGHYLQTRYRRDDCGFPMENFEQREEIYKGIREIENTVSYLKNIVNPDKTVIVSDHGFGANNVVWHTYSSALVTWNVDDTIEQIIDTRKLLCKTLGIEQSKETYGKRAGKVTPEDKAGVKKRLRQLGYYE